MRWKRVSRNGRRPLVRAPSLVAVVALALLAAIAVPEVSAGAPGTAGTDATTANTPPDLLGDALGYQSTPSGFGQFYPPPIHTTLDTEYETLFTVDTPSEVTALDDIQALAVSNTLKGFDLPESDTSAVQTWGRDDAEVELFALLLQAANEQNGGSAVVGLSSADVLAIQDWLTHVTERQSELSNDYAGLEFVKWAGLDQQTYLHEVAQLNFDINTAAGSSNVSSDESTLKSFLSQAPNDFANSVGQPTNPGSATDGFCVYTPPPAPAGIDNYPTYTGDTGGASASGLCSQPGGGVGCLISCLPTEPVLQSFQEWGVVDAEATVNGSQDYAATATDIGLALGSSAIVGSVGVGTALAGTLIATGALTGTGLASAVSSLATNTGLYSAYAGETAADAAAATSVAETAAGSVAATGVGAIVAAVILFVIGTVEEALQLAQFLGEPSQVAGMLEGGSDPCGSPDKSPCYPDIGAFLSGAGASGVTQLFSLFVQSTLPTPVDNRACPPVNGSSQCLNPPPPPAPTPGNDPIFAVTAQGQNQPQYQSSISWYDTASEVTTQARLVNTDAGTTAHDAWFVEQLKDHNGASFQATYNTGVSGTEFQTLRMHYTDWNGNDEDAYLLWVPSASAYEFTPGTNDVQSCITTPSSCSMSPTVDYMDSSGNKYSAQVVSPLPDSLTVAPTYSANPVEGSPVTFHANAATTLTGVGINYQWQYQQQWILIGGIWFPCGVSGSAFVGSCPSSSPVGGDGAQITFPSSGQFNVTLTATNSLGFSTNDTFSVNVSDVAPVLQLSSVNNNPFTDFICSVEDNGVPTCNVTSEKFGDTTAIGGAIVHAGAQDTESLSVNWGDGTTNTYNYEPNAALPSGLPGWPSSSQVPFIETHTYAEPGAYTATVSVTDQAGTTTSQALPEDVYTSTTTTVSSQPDPSVSGQSVTLQATILPTATLPSTFSGAPTGTVTFYDLSNGELTELGTASPGGAGNAPGVATLDVSSLGVGTHPLEAVYGGDSVFLGSDSGTTSPYSQSVNPAPTTTTLSASPNPVVHGQALSLVATVSVPAPGAGTPTGSVTFTDGTTTLGTASLSASTSGVTSGTLTTSALHVGPHTLGVSYGGNGNLLGSSTTLVVNVDTDLSGFPRLSSGALNAAHANLKGADLFGANLSGASFQKANLVSTILTGADLSGANLKGANLAGADLEGANLTGADLQGTNLNGAIMTGAVTSGVTWKNTTCPDGTSSQHDGGTCLGHL